MFLTDVRTSLQSRLVSLFRRQPPQNISPAVDERLLTPDETAQLLQPHMPKRNASAWLELDRNFDPSLPFIERYGEIGYRLADIRSFIRRMPKGLSNHIKDGNQIYTISDRRSDRDRRNGEYWEVLKERRESIDRRDSFDRRSSFDRRQVKDDFGYGRKGERRRVVAKVSIST